MHPLKRLTRFYRDHRKTASTITAAAVGGLYYLLRSLFELDLWRHGFDSPAVWIFIVIGLGAGLAMFTYGFSVWREKRMIENIPTSKVRSLAMGLVEVLGRAQPKALLKSPITATDCVYYKFLVERRERRGKGEQWVTVSQGASTNYFYVEDETGRILVDPVEADIQLTQDYRYTDAVSAGNTFGLLVNDGKYSNPLRPKISAEKTFGFLTNTGRLGQRMRYTEWYIVPGDQVYIMGTVTRWRNEQQERQFALAQRLKELKADRDRLMQFDRDRDGKIDAEEWEAVRERAEQDILRQELDNPRDESEDLVIARDPQNQLMIISDKSEKDLVKSKTATAWLLLIFGAGLAVASLCFLVGRIRH